MTFFKTFIRNTALLFFWVFCGVNLVVWGITGLVWVVSYLGSHFNLLFGVEWGVPLASGFCVAVLFSMTYGLNQALGRAANEEEQDERWKKVCDEFRKETK